MAEAVRSPQTKERIRQALIRHGMAYTPTHRSWAAMKARCLNSKDPSYGRYGGRGISVCERWLSFDNFYADMGVRPEGTTLDRIDVNGNYEPGNCRWATASEQNRNKRPVSVTHRQNISIGLKRAYADGRR